jgi:vancomycin resistance protein YoaR
MRALGSWTTYYEVGSHNGFSANITVPSMYINGTVVAPGEWFSYLKAIGPITTARGFKFGGAIINGQSVEGTTLGGGMCSSSTTLFNAVLRSGFQIGARRNHYYYIARYPLGLDATVFIDGGYAQDMTFRNDTQYPVLIRAIARPGMIRFTVYSVPTGRTVSLTRPTVKNYISGYTVTRDSTSIPAGTYKQVEYAANGQDVWVTRTVRDRSGRVIHQETYYSHYTRMIGIILHGVA